MQKILILAAAGMAGHVITNVLQKTNNYIIATTIRNLDTSDNPLQFDLDLNDDLKLAKIIQDFQPNFVINCAGILVQNSHNNPGDAIRINSFLPHYLVNLSVKYNFKLIHLSTDCVFEGTKGQYTEHDVPDATSFYGKTKGLGEILQSPHLTIRTSIIGPELKTHGTGLMHWLFNQQGTVKGFEQAIWSGVTTLELAHFIAKVALNPQNSLFGLYHLTNNSPINKYELLVLIKQIFNLSHIQIIPDNNYQSDKSLINRSIAQSNYKVNSYEQMLLELRDYIEQNKLFYSHYPILDTITC